jgi:hypothetical protein
MLYYKPRNVNYPGDSKMRKVTSLSQKQRSLRYNKSISTGTQTSISIGTGGCFSLKKEEMNTPEAKIRICEDLCTLTAHLMSFTTPAGRFKAHRKCAWCGDRVYAKCVICSVPLHNFNSDGKYKHRACSVHWHNKFLFGMAWKDANTLESKDGMRWVSAEATAAAKRANREHILSLEDGDGDNL